MKSPIINLLFLTILFITSNWSYSTNDPYLLTIKKSWHITKKSNTYLVASVALTNNTTDTLKYLGMTCDSTFFYRFDSQMLTVNDESSSCPQNLPKLIIVPPHQNSIITLKFKIIRSPIIYRIGLEVKIVTDNDPAGDFLFGGAKTITIWTKRIIDKQ